MEAVADGRMRLTILGGFLGSGKTTWLRHKLQTSRAFAEALVIVNEAAEIPVDDALLTGSPRLDVLAGGCACCDGLPALIAHLRMVCDGRVAGIGRHAGLERLVLETSGLADPGAIAQALRDDPVLVHHIRVDETVVVIDGLNGLDQLRREPLARRQIESADRLVVSKTDAAGAGQAALLAATLSRLNPGAEITGAVMGETVALPHWLDTGPASLPALAEADPISATRLDLHEGIDWTAFAVWLSALLHARGEDVMRVKGVVRTPAGRLLLQSVRKVVQQPEILPQEGGKADDNSIVIIGRGYNPQDLARSLEKFTARHA